MPAESGEPPAAGTIFIGPNGPWFPPPGSQWARAYVAAHWARLTTGSLASGPGWGMRKNTTATVYVTAPRDAVLRACDPALLAAWNNEYIGCSECVWITDVRNWGTVGFSAMGGGGNASWMLTLTGLDGNRITKVEAEVEEETGLRHPTRWWRTLTKRRRQKLLRRNLDRMKGFAEADLPPVKDELKAGDLVALLNVYTAQFGSFTTLLWQVPALGLTAQAFLMTIVLGAASPSISNGARYAAAGLSIIVALAAIYLMHDQRARAINHAELAKRISYRLSLTNKVLGGSFGLDDAVPKQGTDAQNVWTTNHVIYAGWQLCMALFAIVDVLVIISISFPALRWWFT